MNNNIFDLLYSCFNQFLFQEAKNNIESLEYYFQTNPSTMGNPLVDQLLSAIKTYSLDSIDEPLFRSILIRTGKNAAEQQQILDDIVKWKRYSKDKMEPSRKCIQDIVASVIVQRASRLYSNSPSEYLKYLKNINYQTTDTEILKATSFSNLDINTIVAEEGDSVIPSRYSWLNSTFPKGGIERKQLVLISMPPGSGKSLYCMNELGYMAMNGYNCLYFAMGDLTYKDQIIRLSSQTTGRSFKDVSNDLARVYNEMRSVYGSSIDFMISPAGTVTVEEFRDFLKSSPKQYDVIAVDYDSNFKSNLDDGNMYLEYGNIYNVLVDIAKEMNLVVFCACQPKVGVWNNPVIELSDVGESSRKQHSADICITRSRIPDNPNNLGIFKIVKSRRGDVGSKIYSIRLSNGRFIELPKGVFDLLKEETEKKDYTEGEINMMIRQYEAQMEKLRSGFVNRNNNNLQQSQQTGNGGSMSGSLSDYFNKMKSKG